MARGIEEWKENVNRRMSGVSDHMSHIPMARGIEEWKEKVNRRMSGVSDHLSRRRTGDIDKKMLTLRCHFGPLGYV